MIKVDIGAEVWHSWHRIGKQTSHRGKRYEQINSTQHSLDGIIGILSAGSCRRSLWDNHRKELNRGRFEAVAEFARMAGGGD